jgi:PEP-CTERM motif
MRLLASVAFGAGVQAIATFPVSAAVLTATERVPVEFTLSGFTLGDFLSSPFPAFDPSLGQLIKVSEFVSGSVSWKPGTRGASLRLTIGQIAAQRKFTSPSGNPTFINIELEGDKLTGGFTGKGPIEQNLISFEFPEGKFDGTIGGDITYTYIPAPSNVGGGSPGTAPEPSTWAMMLMGFAGLGYAAVRRKRGVRVI